MVREPYRDRKEDKRHGICFPGLLAQQEDHQELQDGVQMRGDPEDLSAEGQETDQILTKLLR